MQIPSNNEDFGCKVLLSGEYLVIDGAPSLAVPSDVYKGAWHFHKPFQSGHSWEKLVAHLGSLSFMDAGLFYEDLNKGLDYYSSIPVGYGLGSSGALVAGIYRRYAKLIQEDLIFLKSELAQIESFFHGTSSGIDPLVIFLNKAVLTGPKSIQTIDLSSQVLRNWSLFDSGISRATSPLVAHYKEQIKPRKALKLDELKLLNQNLIQGFITNQTPDFDNSLIKNLSELQLDIFWEIIDEATKLWWRKGLATDEFYFKLCGAGGGGMYLVYQNVERLPFSTLSF